MPASAADWARIKQLYTVDGLTPYRIEQLDGINVSRQAIKKRAKKEKWESPSAAVPSVTTASGSPEPSEPDSVTIDVAQIAGELERFDKASEARLTRFLEAYQNGGGHNVAAAYAGLAFSTAKSWRDASPTLAMAIEQIEAHRAQESIGAITKAQKRGDWKAAELLLGRNRLTKEEWGHTARGGQGHVQVNVVLAVPRDGQEPQVLDSVRVEAVE